MITMVGYKSEIVVYIWILLIIYAVVNSIINKINKKKQK
jgi:hypothetical protein